MKCANCKNDAMYVYRITETKAFPYCTKDLPKFLENRRKAGLLELANEYEKTLKKPVVEAPVVAAPVVEAVVEPTVEEVVEPGIEEPAVDTAVEELPVDAVVEEPAPVKKAAKKKAE